MPLQLWYKAAPCTKLSDETNLSIFEGGAEPGLRKAPRARLQVEADGRGLRDGVTVTAESRSESSFTEWLHSVHRREPPG
eukprot:3761449-Rhodomonas_salina.2